MATGDPFREGAHVRKGGRPVLKNKRIAGTFAAMVLASLLVSLLVSLLAGGAAMAATTKTFTDGVQGVEVSAGQIDGNIRRGVTFVGYADGRFPGAMYASLNYTPSSPNPLFGNTIVGGTWVLTGPKGALFGTFTGRKVKWNVDGTVATVKAQMAISGGSVKGKPVTGGSGTFEGTLSHLTFPPTVQGTLTLTAT